MKKNNIFKKHSKINLFTPSEIDALFEASKNDDRAKIALIMIRTGIRLSDLLELPKSAVLLDLGIINMVEKKTGRYCSIRIHPQIAPFLSCFISKETDSPYLISSPDGALLSPLEFKQLCWVPLMQDLGMNHSRHDARSTFFEFEKHQMC